MPKADLSEFRQKVGRPGKPCRVWVLQEDLDKERAAKLNDAIADRSISTQAISSVLQDWGHEVNHQIIYRHRNGNCSCKSRAAQ